MNANTEARELIEVERYLRGVKTFKVGEDYELTGEFKVGEKYDYFNLRVKLEPSEGGKVRPVVLARGEMEAFAANADIVRQFISWLENTDCEISEFFDMVDGVPREIIRGLFIGSARVGFAVFAVNFI